MLTLSNLAASLAPAFERGKHVMHGLQHARQSIASATMATGESQAVERPAHVEVRSVSKRFAVRQDKRAGAPQEVEITALDRIDLRIRNGEFLSLLGPSGCGKTTLLRMIAGLICADEGAILVAGRPVTRPIKQTAMVFQNFGLLPWRTVQRNVEFALELDDIAPSERARIADELLGVVGLGKFAGHYPHELSGGMQQRVGIARALTRKPSLLLMDEPFGALDAQTREELQEEFLNIWATTGTTVVFVTHSIDEALVMSDRIAVFSTRPGRIKSIVDSPFERRGAGTDVRSDPRFIECRAALRDQLR
jgi:NitT/TauT family transport system ATP-binding protein